MKRASIPSASGSLGSYLKDIGQFPLLTAEQERELARTCRSALVTANLRFVVKIASEYVSCGFKLVDLIQEGNLGLMKAVEKFDPDKGVRLVSYAVWWIRAYIQAHILGSHSLVRIGTTSAQRRLFFALARTKRDLDQKSVEHGADSDGESYSLIARQLRVKPGEVEEMTMRLSGRDLSLDAPAVDGETSHVEWLAGEAPPQDHALSAAQERQLLRARIVEALSRLDWRERYVIEQRVMSEDPATLREIGDHLGISHERARQLELRAKRKLGAELQEVASEVDWPTNGYALSEGVRSGAV
jgi:RNA polymerase sigma-32 factor